MATTVFELLGAGAVAVVGVHHSAKSAANKQRTLENALRGSGDLGAMSDAVYSLTVQDAESLQVKVECVKARDFEPVAPFEIQGRPFITDTQDFGLLAKIDEPRYARQEQQRQAKFLEAIQEDPHATYPELQERLGIPSMKAVQRLAKVLGWQKRRDLPWQKASETVN